MNHAPIELLDETKDVSTEFKYNVFDKKLRTNLNKYDKEAYRNINYLSNMYVYSNYCVVMGTYVEYKTQTGEEINSQSVRFLN